MSASRSDTPDPADREGSFEASLSSKPMVFVIGREKKEYHVHKHLIAQLSPALSAIVNSPGRTAKEGRIEWRDIDPDTFVQFARFAYSNDYVEAEPDLLPHEHQEQHRGHRREASVAAALASVTTPPSDSLATKRSSTQENGDEQEDEEEEELEDEVEDDDDEDEFQDELDDEEEVDEGEEEDEEDDGMDPHQRALLSHDVNVTFAFSLHSYMRNWRECAETTAHDHQSHSHDDDPEPLERGADPFDDADNPHNKKRRRLSTLVGTNGSSSSSAEHERNGGNVTTNTTSSVTTDSATNTTTTITNTTTETAATPPSDSNPTLKPRRDRKFETICRFANLHTASLHASSTPCTPVGSPGRRREQRHTTGPPSSRVRTWRPRKNIGPRECFEPVLLSHAKLYLFAHRFSVQPLRALTLYRLHKSLLHFVIYPERVSDLIALARHIYDSTDEDDDEARAVVVAFFGCIVENVRGCEEFRALLRENVDFANDLMIQVVDRLD